MDSGAQKFVSLILFLWKFNNRTDCEEKQKIPNYLNEELLQEIAHELN